MRITVVSAVRARISPGDTLYVFVRAAGESGGPPLAARRLSAGHFPLTVKLSDQNAIIQGTKLGAHHRLEVVALVSKSGKPLKQSGDIMGESRFSWEEASPTFK